MEDMDVPNETGAVTQPQKRPRLTEVSVLQGMKELLGRAFIKCVLGYGAPAGVDDG